MYRPKKHVRLTALTTAPRVADVKSLLSEATKARGCTVELPWRNKRTKVHYSLTVRVELSGGDPVWTLYEGEGGGSRVVWSSSFEDVDLLYDVLTLSIPEEVSTALADDEWAVEGGRSSAARPSREVASLDEKPPGFYESGLLKEEDLEYYKQRERAKPEEREPVRAKEPEPAAAREPEPQPKPQPKADPEPEPAPAAAPNPQSSGAYPQQPYPAPYPMPGTPYSSGAYPVPPGYGYPPGYPQGYPPGYQYPPGYPPHGYPPGYPPQGYPGYPPAAGTVAVQPGGVPPGQVDTPGMAAAGETAGGEGSKNRPNVKLGQFLVESGLVPQLTVDAALQLQDLVRTGALPTAKAAEAVRRAHVRGGQVDPAITAIGRQARESLQNIAPPLGQILVEAAILRGPVLRKALYLQQKVRNGALSRQEAIDSLCAEVFGVGGESEKAGETHESQRALDLLKAAGLVSDFDLETANKVKEKHGGRIVSILASAGKLDKTTVDAAIESVELISADKLKHDKAIIALHYCQRSRVGLKEALSELGWHDPGENALPEE